MTFNYRIRLNGKMLRGEGYVHMANAIRSADDMILTPGDVVQVVDDGVDSERIVYTRNKGAAHAI